MLKNYPKRSSLLFAKSVSARLLIVAVAASLTGCLSDYPTSNAAFRAAHETGDFIGAAAQASTAATQGGASQLLWTLEEAAAQRAAGNIPAAVAALERAETLLDAIDGAPEISLSGEGISSLSNPYALDYRGRNLDRTLSATLLALCYLELGETDRVRVALNRALFRIEDARRIADRRLAIAREEGDAAASEDSEFRARLGSSEMRNAENSATGEFGALPTYAGLVNPVATWLSGLFFLHTAEGPADLERARKSLQMAAAAAGSQVVAADLALAEAGTGRPDPGAGRTLVYILHEAGNAPRWREERISLPLIFADSAAPIVGISFPAVAPAGGTPSPLKVSWSEGQLPEANLLASVDSMVLAEFREEWPVVRNRAIASATVKAIASYIANKAAQEYARQNSDNSGAQLMMLATLIATNVYSASSQADLRHWSALPSVYRLQRGDVPRGSTLTLSAEGQVGSSISLPSARAVLITVRSVASGVAPSVHTCILQP